MSVQQFALPLLAGLGYIQKNLDNLAAVAIAGAVADANAAAVADVAFDDVEIKRHCTLSSHEYK